MEGDFKAERVVFVVHVLSEDVGVIVELLAVDAQYGLIIDAERIRGRVPHDDLRVAPRGVVPSG